MNKSNTGETAGLVVGILAVALCCGGPLLVASLLAGGFGVALLGQGALVLGLVGVVGGVVLALTYALRRRRGVPGSSAQLPSGPTLDDCCAPLAAPLRREPREKATTR